jgi:hypothetical protein
VATFPNNDNELLKEAFSISGAEKKAWIFPWFLLLIFLACILLEWFYSPVEKSLGKMMVWSSSVRPEAGRGWDLSREGAEAMKTLDELTNITRLRKTAGAGLADWDGVSTKLDSFQVFSVSTGRFIELYNQLPPALQGLIFDPVDLLRIRTSGNWQRVFFMRDRDRDYVSLVDSYNVVLLQGQLDNGFYERYSSFNRPLFASLMDIEQYSLIVSADRFFSVLAPSGNVQISSDDVQWITSLDGQLRRIGIVEHSESGVWELGFEIIQENRTYVNRYWVSEKIGSELVVDLFEFNERLVTSADTLEVQ